MCVCVCVCTHVCMFTHTGLGCRCTAGWKPRAVCKAMPRAEARLLLAEGRAPLGGLTHKNPSENVLVVWWKGISPVRDRGGRGQSSGFLSWVFNQGNLNRITLALSIASAVGTSQGSPGAWWPVVPTEKRTAG